jgi:hypothetical protein
MYNGFIIDERRCMTVIAWHTYEPGFVDDGVKSSAGGGAWMRRLFSAFSRGGIEVAWLPAGKNPAGTISLDKMNAGVSDIDVAVFAWRWPMPAYPERDQLYVDQMHHIDDFIKAKVPVLVHDQDHRISETDREWLVRNGVVISEPSLLPLRGTRKLMFPNPYVGEQRFRVEEHRVPFLSYYKLVYVGNNYGRFDQTVKFVAPFSARFPTKMYGNWMEPHPEREAPEIVRANLPQVSFGLRIQQEQVIDALAEADTTIHLFKPSYGPCGFTTIRWAEAVAARTPAFIPSDFNMPDEWRERFGRFVVKDGSEMAEVFNTITEVEYLDALHAQEDFVDEEMRVEPWLDLLTKMAKGGHRNA